MNDSSYRGGGRRVVDPDDPRFILDDIGLSVEPGERFWVDAVAGHPWRGRRGTVRAFGNRKREPLATVCFDGADRVEWLPRRSMRPM